MADSDSLSLPARLFIRAVLNIGLVWGMTTYMGQYFVLTGGIQAFIIVGALLTLMNIFVRPILAVLTLPLKLFATVLAIIIVNGVFVQLTHEIVQYMEEGLVTLEINGGLWGWILVAVILGLGNWIMKVLMK
ncbi:phage holin family protein [Candidatus Peregrinibacteria bacterium]|jgi:putative membrane protein|nr:phage holin family protein [Candidatus Peregrinibacteria bacterium]MBT3598524.1 phage holin family protein [Candidatus Peregrinibacteria bacterium]MBT4586080.1 phage holin family protein [Candidatus Peregrinibacteria bacterium]MBT6730346.1 phage holin family protein [Candidatus Peregrinibacteria bacterium]MBT7009024.1 phage holin family protein [Candidatus Peregrinibacteria bacterium]